LDGDSSEILAVLQSFGDKGYHPETFIVSLYDDCGILPEIKEHHKELPSSIHSKVSLNLNS
jgi:hypothetical protein